MIQIHEIGTKSENNTVFRKAEQIPRNGTGKRFKLFTIININGIKLIY